MHIANPDCRTTADPLPGDRRTRAAQPSTWWRHDDNFCAFAKPEARVWPMSDEILTRVLAGLQGRRFRDRSDLYRWLRANYKRLALRLEQDQISWGVLAREIAAAGLKNKKGAPPSADSVRRIWRTVCRDLAREAAAKAQRPHRISHSLNSKQRKRPTLPEHRTLRRVLSPACRGGARSRRSSSPWWRG